MESNVHADINHHKTGITVLSLNKAEFVRRNSTKDKYYQGIK